MKEKKTWLYAFAKVIAPVIFGLPIGHTVVKGKNNIPEKGRFIVCSNHISMADPIVLALAQKRQIHFMAKQELFNNPFVSWVVRSLGAFPIKRGASDTTSINQAFDILEKERVLGIFPEGTRSKDGELLKPKAGAALIAFKEQAPVIPAAIYAKDHKIGLFRKVYVAFGEPMTMEELGMTTGNAKELRDASRNIMNEIAKLRQECIDFAQGRENK